VAELLVVEDDATIGSVLAASLRTHGHAVRWAASGREALSAAGNREFDLALLDLGLPDIDGIEVCRRLRAAQPGCVLVVLTARDEEIDVVVGLEAGADDYLTKPFRLAELLARVAAHLRRGPGTGGDPERSGRVLVVGALEVDLAARQARLGGEEIVVRPKESIEWTRRFTEVGLFVGLSSGAIMAGAVKCANTIGDNDAATIVTIVADDGWKYLSTGAWSDDIDDVVERAKSIIYF